MDLANVPFHLVLTISCVGGLCLIVIMYFITSKGSSLKRNVSVKDMSVSLQMEEKKSDHSADNSSPTLKASIFTEFKVLQVKKISHNTKMIRFEIPFGKALNLPIGRHVSVRAEIDGSKVMRAYTPTSRNDQKGYFDLLVKKYEFGKMSQHLHSLHAGSSLEVRGPVGRFKYEKNSFNRIGLIAGGTGLTPCLQIVRCILEGPEGEGDNTSFVLFFQNRSLQDILLKQEVDGLVTKFPNRFQVVYFLSNSESTPDWGQTEHERKGYIDKSSLTEFMAPTVCPLVCLCGPSGFNEMVRALLADCGHTDASVHVW